MPAATVDATAAPPVNSSIKEPPSTPRTRIAASPFVGSSPPPAPRPFAASALHPLMKALVLNALDDVRTALVTEPEAATTVFFDHQWEPPLCAATRLQCSLEIIDVLLEHGADANAEDIHGRTALAILGELAQQHDGADDANSFLKYASGCPFADVWEEERQVKKEWLNSVQQQLVRHGARGESVPSLNLGVAHGHLKYNPWIPDAPLWLSAMQLSAPPVVGHIKTMDWLY